MESVLSGMSQRRGRSSSFARFGTVAVGKVPRAGSRWERLVAAVYTSWALHSDSAVSLLNF